MSTFKKTTRHPIRHDWQHATWYDEIRKLLIQGASPEEFYFVLHKVINGNESTFYDTIMESKEWQDWEQKAYKKGSLLEWFNPLKDFEMVSYQDAAFGGISVLPFNPNP